MGWALKFYDIRFRYVPTPKAKGKTERAPPYWQAHRNEPEVQRELRQTPPRA